MMKNMNIQKICPKCGALNKSTDNYCTRCGTGLEPAGSKYFEIFENLKGSLIGSIICLAIFVAFMVLVSFIIGVEYPGKALIPLLIIWPIIILFLIWAQCYLRGLGKMRRFIITDKYIDIMVPHKPHFRINWDDFDEIEITKRESMAMVPSTQGLIFGPRFVYFTLIFRGKDPDISYEFESGKDFKVRSRKKILEALKEYTTQKGKGFTGYKWIEKRRAKKAKKEAEARDV